MSSKVRRPGGRGAPLALRSSPSRPGCTPAGAPGLLPAEARGAAHGSRRQGHQGALACFLAGRVPWLRSTSGPFQSNPGCNVMNGVMDDLREAMAETTLTTARILERNNPTEDRRHELEASALRLGVAQPAARPPSARPRAWQQTGRRCTPTATPAPELRRDALKPYTREICASPARCDHAFTTPAAMLAPTAAAIESVFSTVVQGPDPPVC